MQESTYVDDMRIDENMLEVEWLEQPTLMFKYSKLAAEVRKRLDRCKDSLDLVKANLDTAIRSDPEQFNISKITEAVVTNTILQQDEYQEAQTELVDVKYELDLAMGAVYAINARKDALENLVKLYGMQYFAGPKDPHNVTEVRAMQKEKREKDAASKVGKALKKRKSVEEEEED